MTRLHRLTALAGLSVLAACGTDSTGPDGGIPKSPDAAKIESIITALPDWVDNMPSQRAPVARPAVFLREALGLSLIHI